MNIKKGLIAIGLASIVAVISACGSEERVDETEPFFFGEAVQEREHAFTYTHIHGMSINPEDTNKIFLASHDGLIEFNKQNGEAYFVGSERFDLMGFSQVADSAYLMTSGHPEPGSSLEDPLGFMWSEDLGETWEIRSYYGMIDFHALTSTQNQDKLLSYAIDNNDHFIFKSTDKGYSWEVVNTNGLPLEGDEFFDLAIAPNNDDVVYAATSSGLMYSENGGVDWSRKVEGFVTALNVVSDNEVIFYEASQSGLYRLKGEEFITYDLYLQTDAANYIVINNSSEVTVATFQNNLYETADHGENWKQLVEEGNF